MKSFCFASICRVRPIPAVLLLAFAGGGCSSPPRGPAVFAPPPTASETPASQPAAPAATGAAAGGERRPTVEEMLKQAAARPPAKWEGEGWRALFDGQTLHGWEVTKFAARGEVAVRDGLIHLAMGEPFTGMHWTNAPPAGDYELALEAMRVNGWDFFCGLTFPVRDSFCSLIVGGWGGGLVGLSNVDGYDASENETTRMLSFETGRWYRVRVRVARDRIQAWIDDERLVDLVTKERRISLRPGDIELSKPLGVCAWSTGAAVRNISLRNLP